MGGDCCRAWDGNRLIASTGLMVARADGFPVADGHALVIPRRHVESLLDLTSTEWLDLYELVSIVCEGTAADGWTVAVNDGPAAGRTVHHLHVHVIPRRWGDVEDPRGGVRQLLTGGPGTDPWIHR